MTRIFIIGAATLLILTATAPAEPDTSPATTAPADELARIKTENTRLRQRVDELEESNPLFWIVIGFVGQVIFGLRFVVQWIATEKQKKSVIPVTFWYLSLLGSMTLLSYAIYRLDPVFIAGFSLNMIIYVRNLYFIHIHPRKMERLGEKPEKTP